MNNELSKEKQKEYIDKFCEKYKIAFIGEDIFQGLMFDFYAPYPDNGRMFIAGLDINTIIYDDEAKIEATWEQLAKWRLHCKTMTIITWQEWIKNGN